MIQNNKMLKIAVCDDDKNDRQHLISLLTEYLDKKDYLVTIDEYETGEAFLAAGTDPYGLVFLDIYMPGMLGMETAEKMFSENQRRQIV